MNSKLKQVLFAAGLLLIVCGASVARATSDNSDQCQTLTPEQAQKILGQSFEAPTKTPLSPPFGDKWGTHCTYRSQHGGNVVIDFFIYVTASPTQAKQWFDMGMAAGKPESKLQLGDAAYIESHGHEVHVLKGKVLYWIIVSGAHDAKTADLAASVAAHI
jgi:hypothetical protein